MRFALEALFADVPAEQVAEARAFYGARTAGRGPVSFEELKAVRARRSAPPAADPPAVEEMAEAAGARVPVRVFLPSGGPPRGVHLDIHGGGFYMDTAAHGDVRNRSLAEALGAVVVSVDYRLAPEDPWPAAPDDCETAALWLVEQAEARFGTSRLAIGGTSAGATLALATLLRLRDRSAQDVPSGPGGAAPAGRYGDAVSRYGYGDAVSRFTGAALQFGTYDLSALTPAGRRIADEYFIQAYVGHVPDRDRTLPDISPLYADLTGLPPALLVVGAEDILLEDNLTLAGRLSAAGNGVELRLYPAAPHGFTGHPTALAATALADVDSWLRERLTRP
ncbi:alpha/beta hydrolase fold domain-containing protein [Streptomyces sp. DH8]|uniref:alpha/beta hydrolase fold domain-containing protein n=1 Tax=Streptomyces sp. DH8 TaxID=2857008 RepID=UPI001E3F9723|nr:alpha/beta hydrolase fold domain-containing protein [Streptomyces sp. DH8]